MTREEIINEIKQILSELDNGEDAVSYLTQNDVKWLNENIKTLEQEPKYCDRNICVRNEHNGIGCGECEVTKSQEPCEDAISREQLERELHAQMAVDAISKEVALDMLEHLPPVTPQPKTIQEKGE